MSKIRMTLKENVVVGDVKFKAQPAYYGCRGCAFRQTEKLWWVCSNVACTPLSRNDKQSVIFVKKKKKKEKEKENSWIPTNSMVPNLPPDTTVEWKSKKGLRNTCYAASLCWCIGTDNEVTHYRVIK